MLIVISNRPERIKAHGHLWGDFDVFTSRAETVREAHHDLAVHATEENWDESVRVIQDDVTFEMPWPEHRGRVTSYHPGKTYHTCPRAFSATGEGWQWLSIRWQFDGRTCELWRPDHWYDTARLITEADLG